MRAKITFTEEQKNFIKEQFNMGKTQKDIISMLMDNYNIKCGLTTLLNLYKELNINSKKKYFIDEDELILNLIDGLNYEEIAEKLNTTVEVLNKYIVKHNIIRKVENKKVILHTWIGNNTIDLRKIKDESIDDIEQYLNCKLEKNATVEIDGKKFIFDFYSKENDIAFLCCLNNPEKDPFLLGTPGHQQPNRKHSITDRAQWDWILKIKENNPLITIVSYFYWDSKVTADHINEIMKDPFYIDEEEEKRKSSSMYSKEVLFKDNKTFYYD